MMESHVFRFRDVVPRDLTPDSTMLHYVNLFSIELLSVCIDGHIILINEDLLIIH